MLKNYLSLSLKVLKRKPFYTFIALFGISFTLMILMLLTSMADAMYGANAPMTERDRMLILPMVEERKVFYDTIYTIDTIPMENGIMRYDSSFTLQEGGRNNSNGSAGYRFLDSTLRKLENVEYSTFFSPNSNVDAYLDGRKVTMNVFYADAAYWKVFDFKFNHGRPFAQEDVEGGTRVAVITDKTAAEYFGSSGADIIGRELTLGRETFRVVGITERPLNNSELLKGDVFVPVTTIDPRSLNNDIRGRFVGAFLAEDAARISAIQEQISFIADNYDFPPDSDYEVLEIFTGTVGQVTAGGLLQSNDYKQAVWIVLIPVLLLSLLFLLLPLINLINLNISRVYERKSEIAVRKAFGADSGDILRQFLFENLVLTIIGGLTGMALALVMIQYINAKDLLGIVRLAFSPKVFLYSILLIIAFGFLSGVLPAYRMSRTNVANALR